MSQKGLKLKMAETWLSPFGNSMTVLIVLDWQGTEKPCRLYHLMHFTLSESRGSAELSFFFSDGVILQHIIKYYVFCIGKNMSLVKQVRSEQPQ